MTTLHQSPEAVIAYVKGAPERVLERCKKALWDEESMVFDSATALAEAEQLGQ